MQDFSFEEIKNSIKHLECWSDFKKDIHLNPAFQYKFHIRKDTFVNFNSKY